MKIKSIAITNIKGIDNKIFNLDLLPNKPNLLVAPNGFGKSSFGIAFDSLKRDKIVLDDKNYYLNDITNRPELKIVIEDGATIKTLISNDTSNTISNDFDVFVINSKLTAKASLRRIGGISIPKSSLEIEPTILINTIPAKILFDYNFADTKRNFGINSKILPNISSLLKSSLFLSKIEDDIDFNKFSLVGNSATINSIINDINLQIGTSEQIKNWLSSNKINDLRGVRELSKLSQIIQNIDNTITNEVDSYLASFQIISLKSLLGVNFRKACKYIHYLSEKDEYEAIINSVNSTRITIKPKEDASKGLIVEWPKAHLISNGQRDVLTFITLLLRARRNFKKRDCILIIDEIFDYLDDANLISFQYFITKFIDDMKSSGKNLFPILMTHLDPLFFNHFCFNRHKIKVAYLKDVPYTSNPNILKLIKKREDPTIESLAVKHHFHFSPIHINLSVQFQALGLPPTWGESEKFHLFIANEVTKYLNDQTDYDPLAICFGVRVKIESLLHSKITNPAYQQKFLDEHGTKKKLDYCEEIGLDVPETYYLLGIIYNDRLHWREGLDIIRPVAIKLENLTIKKLIRDIFEIPN